MRIVLDTNVLVAALLSPAGPPNELLQHWERGSFKLITSRQQQLELGRVLAYPKLQSRVPPEQAAVLVQKMEAVAEFAEDLPQIDASDDPDDNVILATAIAGAADWVVTGDKKHLLPLRNVEGVAIVAVDEALARLAPPPSSDEA